MGGGLEEGVFFEAFPDFPADAAESAGGRATCLFARASRAGLALGDEVDADLVAEGVGDSGEHVEAVAVVVGVLQAADDGLGRPDPGGQVLLAQAN